MFQVLSIVKFHLELIDDKNEMRKLNGKPDTIFEKYALKEV